MLRPLIQSLTFTPSVIPQPVIFRESCPFNPPVFTAALHDTFLSLATTFSQVANQPAHLCGSTASVLLLLHHTCPLPPKPCPQPPKAAQQLAVLATVGDSPAVLCSVADADLGSLLQRDVHVAVAAHLGEL